MKFIGLFIIHMLVSYTKGASGNFANQVHLSLGENETAVVTWSTDLYYADSTLELLDIQRNTTTIIEGKNELFVDNGTLHYTQTIHRVSFKATPGDTFA